MGNCLFGGVGDAENEDVVKVITSTNGVMEFYAPITVESIADEFPGHGIFRSHDLFWNPLPHHEVLLAGNSYYLLPLDKSRRSSAGAGAGETVATFEIGHVRSNSVPQIPPPLVASYRMSFDSRGILLKRSYTGAGASFSRHGFGYGYGFGYGSSGFWKVKLVISPKQLVEILSEDTATEELIESIRTVAKCGKGGGAGVSSVAFSDQWSLSSSRNASSKKDGVLSLELS